MNKKLYLRADASVQIGYGHFIRTLALADMLKDEFDCTFFTQSPTPYQKEEVNRVCKLVELPSDNSKFDLFLKYLKGEEIVVLDNYFYSSNYEKSIKEKGCKLVSIGTNDRHYYADVVVNFTKLQPLDFSAEIYTKFCLGLGWTIIRKPFYEKRHEAKDNIVICIGGTDQYSFSEKFYDCIKSKYPQQKVVIISTDRIGVKRIEGIRVMGADLMINLSPEQMARQFAKAQVAVVSASSVAIEALSQGAEVIAGTYVDNQVNIYKALNEDGYIWGVGNFCDVNIDNKILTSIDTIKNGERKKPFVAHDTIIHYQDLFRDLCK